MKLTYFWSSDTTRKPFSADRNEGIEAVPHLLKELRARGCDVESVDTANMTEKQRFESYSHVALPAVYKHYDIRKMLGTNRRSACWFGAEVPALLAADSDSIGDAYPHRKESRITTIHGFLVQLLATRAADTN